MTRSTRARDIYSFGALMFEVLTGQHLLPSSTAVGVLTKHLTAEPDAPSMRAPKMGIPPRGRSLCRKALARDPAQRWQTARRARASDRGGLRGDGRRDGTAARSKALARARAASQFRRRRATRATSGSAARTSTRSSAVSSGGACVVVAAPRSCSRGARGGACCRDASRSRRRRASASRTTIPRTRRGSRPAARHRIPRQARMRRTRAIATCFVVQWPAGSRRVVSVAVTAPPNIDINLALTDGDGVHGATADEGGVGDGEVLHRRAVDGPIVITVGADDREGSEAARRERQRPVHADGDRGAARPARPSRTASRPTRTPLELTQELRGYLDTRDDVDLLRWTGGDGTYNVVVRADGLPLAWRVGDGKPRTPGAATVELAQGDADPSRAHRHGGKGPLPGRDATWSIVVDEASTLDAREAHRRCCVARRWSRRGVRRRSATCALAAVRVPATTDGHPDPLGAGADRGARRPHARAADLPAVPSGLDHVEGRRLRARERSRRARDRGCGDSDLYDPWGGRPVGLARVEDGALVEPNNFGELFLLTGRSTVVTDSVTVINDGSDGKPAIIRARGKLHPLPFFEIADRGRLQRRVHRHRRRDRLRARAGRATTSTCAMRYASPRDTRRRECRRRCTRSCTRSARRSFQPGTGFDDRCRARRTSRSSTTARRAGRTCPATARSAARRCRRRASSARSRRGFTIRRAARSSGCTRSIVIGGPGPRRRVQAAAARTRGDGAARDHGHRHARRRAGRRRARPRDRRRRRTTDARDHRCRRRVHAARARRRANVRLDAYQRGDAIGTARSAPATAATIDLPRDRARSTSPRPRTARACRRACRCCRRPARRCRRCRRVTASRRSPAAACTSRTRSPATSRCRAPPGTWEVDRVARLRVRARRGRP